MMSERGAAQYIEGPSQTEMQPKYTSSVSTSISASISVQDNIM